MSKSDIYQITSMQLNILGFYTVILIALFGAGLRQFYEVRKTYSSEDNPNKQNDKIVIFIKMIMQLSVYTGLVLACYGLYCSYISIHEISNNIFNTDAEALKRQLEWLNSIHLYTIYVFIFLSQSFFLFQEVTYKKTSKLWSFFIMACAMVLIKFV